MTSGIMDRLIHPLLDRAKFMHRLGLIRGCFAYGRVKRNERLTDRAHLYSLKVPEYSEPIWLRAGDSDGFVFGQVMIDWQYNFPQVDDVRLIVDAGANIGISALYFARRYPGARIIAIEPDPENYAMLERNTRHLPAIRAVQGAVWPRRASLSIIDPTRSRASKMVSEGEGRGPGGIRSVQLDDIVAEHGRIDILKLDIEGSEKALFEDPSCAGWLAQTHVIYTELHDWMRPGASRTFYRAITGFDFSQQHLGEVVAITLHHAANRL